ncbi:unnamed protein product [Clavelina lepadiformis]|uniref:Uncharacterized protein n=1 Tax=Clavelina lepadiformis TaxID=159417 RepID=A0ABP0H6K7_CLALP
MFYGITFALILFSYCMQLVGDIPFCHNLRQTAAIAGKERIYRDAYGSYVAETPFSWQEVTQKLVTKSAQFGRTVEGLKVYRRYMNGIKKEWKSIDSYCKHRYLKYPYSIQTENGKMIKYVKDDAISPVKSGMVLERNNYPYHLSPGIGHYVVWSVRNQSMATYQKFVNERFPSNAYDVIVFENMEESKSVKSVVHVHAFVRTKKLNLCSLRTHLVSRNYYYFLLL